MQVLLHIIFSGFAPSSIQKEEGAVNIGGKLSDYTCSVALPYNLDSEVYKELPTSEFDSLENVDLGYYEPGMILTDEGTTPLTLATAKLFGGEGVTAHVAGSDLTKGTFNLPSGLPMVHLFIDTGYPFGVNNDPYCWSSFEAFKFFVENYLSNIYAVSTNPKKSLRPKGYVFNSGGLTYKEENAKAFQSAYDLVFNPMYSKFPVEREVDHYASTSSLPPGEDVVANLM